MTIREWKAHILTGDRDEAFAARCGIAPERIPEQRARAVRCAELFAQKYDAEQLRAAEFFSVGGRSEISGNHTDHNHGRVIAASISLDVLAFASRRGDGVIRVQSEGFDEDVVPPSAADAPDPSKRFTSAAIIAGMERAFLDAGYAVGGFDAATTSNVLKGSGLSSSAAFEVMIGNILNHLYNDGRVPAERIARMAQFAENKYFGKPCGLMDQTACAVGGFITIDFADPEKPVIEKLPFDLSEAGYTLCITDTGGNHADLNEDYASVPAEMKSVAAALGVTVLRETTREAVLSEIGRLRAECGDRAVLRALHFFAENERVAAQVEALRAGDLDGFLCGVLASGSSSFRYLQNVYTTKNVREQGLSLALCLTERYLTERGSRAAWRVHSGGFAGTIQAFVPASEAAGYAAFMESVFGQGAVYTLRIRPEGAICLR